MRCWRDRRQGFWVQWVDYIPTLQRVSSFVPVPESAPLFVVSLAAPVAACPHVYEHTYHVSDEMDPLRRAPSEHHVLRRRGAHHRRRRCTIGGRLWCHPGPGRGRNCFSMLDVVSMGVSPAHRARSVSVCVRARVLRRKCSYCMRESGGAMEERSLCSLQRAEGLPRPCPALLALLQRELSFKHCLAACALSNAPIHEAR